MNKQFKDISKMSCKEAYDELAYNIHHMPKDIRERRSMVRRNHALSAIIDKYEQQFLLEIA